MDQNEFHTMPFYFEMYCSHLASHEEVHSCMIDTDCMMEDKNI